MRRSTSRISLWITSAPFSSSRTRAAGPWTCWERVSRTRTWCPSDRSVWTRGRPMNPAPPVIRIRTTPPFCFVGRRPRAGSCTRQGFGTRGEHPREGSGHHTCSFGRTPPDDKLVQVLDVRPVTREPNGIAFCGDERRELRRQALRSRDVSPRVVPHETQAHWP